MKLFVAAALAAGALVASVAQAEDLLAVYEDALHEDPQIREAEANRRAAREARPQAIASLLPQISGTAARQRAKADFSTDRLQLLPSGVAGVTTSRGSTDETSTNWSLNLRQSVFSWVNWVQLRRASHVVAQAEADYQAAEQDLIFRVAQRYFAVLEARNNVEANLAAQEAFNRQLEQADRRFEVGLIAITDVQEARAARDASAADVIASKRALSTAEELLREFTARQYASLARPGDDMPLLNPQPADAEKWVELSMEQNLALISSRLAADIARDDVRAAFGGHLPEFDLVAGRSSTDARTDQTLKADPLTRPNDISVGLNNDSDDRSISLQVTVPIFSGGATQSRVRESQFRWIAARERFTRTSRETERLARDAYLGVISEISRVNALRQALESSRTALAATQAGYEVGTRTAVDVLTAQRTLVQAETDYAASRYDYLLNLIQLRLASGNLDRETLTEINSWLTATEPAAPTAAGQNTPAAPPVGTPTPAQ